MGYIKPTFIQGEAKSLELIERAAPGLAPNVFRLGTIVCKDDEEDEEEEAEERPFMISEYKFLQPLGRDHSLVLARRLALELHAFRSDQGWRAKSFLISRILISPRLWIRVCDLLWCYKDSRRLLQYMGRLLC